MLEALRGIADDLVRYAAGIHPALKYREIVIGFRTLAAGVGRQHEVQGSAARDPFDDHRRAIESHAPCGDDRRTWQRRIVRKTRVWPDIRREAGERGSNINGNGSRSEEQTSELQSLMRISYAVFGLKNKTQTG